MSKSGEYIFNQPMKIDLVTIDIQPDTWHGFVNRHGIDLSAEINRLNAWN